METPSQDSTRPRQLDIGRTLADRYRVIERIGEGGVATVYLAEHLATGNRVALKVLSPEFAGSNDEAVSALLEEALTVSRLGHDNIIDVYFAGRSADGLVYLAMEYLDGLDLGVLIRRAGALDWRRARPILLQLTRALSAVHRAGVVHSDLKPDNIFLVTRDGIADFVKVVDFGIAKALGARPSQAGKVSGTPQFMAPEQAVGSEIDARTDVYALGCVAYEAVTGRLAFDGESPIDVLASQVADAPVPPHVRRPDLDIPPGVERIVLRAMEKDPARRYQSMDEMGEAIERVRFTTGGTAVSGASLRLHDPRPRRRARQQRVRAWTVAVGVGCSALAALLLVLRPRIPAHIQVGLDPPGSTLLVDGQPAGTGPAVAVTASVGKHTLTAHAPGYLPATREIRVGEGDWHDIRLRLPPSPATGLDLTSSPPDLPVWLDGQPLLLEAGGAQVRTGRPARHIAPGAHVVEVRRGDSVWQNHVLVEPDRLLRVHAVLDAPDQPRRPRRARPRRSWQHVDE